MPTKLYKRVYVWELPVRIFHWLNALAITVLIVTGFIIADPPALMSKKEAYETFMMGTVRFIHFTAAYVFAVVMLLRIYWAFVGNKYAHWKAFIPFSKKALHNISHVVKHDIFLLPEKSKDYYSGYSVGHNYMATTIYAVMFVMGLVMLFTGFGLLSDNATWWFPKMFGWVPEFLGGDFITRQIHHLTMWAFILFILVHVYLAVYHDVVEARGEISSMISGFKFVRVERFKWFRKKKKLVEDLEKIEETVGTEE
jgi:Ni/Fe-hydrogenase 1 B-type cytochrome subunit